MSAVQQNTTPTLKQTRPNVKAQNVVQSFVQRIFKVCLTKPYVEIDAATGSVSVQLEMDAVTLNEQGISFFANGHPEFLAPKVKYAIIEAANRTVPSYHYFGQLLQSEINEQLTPTIDNGDKLILPVKIDIITKYLSILPANLNNKALVLNFKLEFGSK